MDNNILSSQDDVGSPSYLSTLIENATTEAILYLAEILQCSHCNHGSHETVTIAGWMADDDARNAIAAYMVGIRACAIDAALNIKVELEETQVDRNELLRNVLQIVRTETETGTDLGVPNWIVTERNPWIAEAIWHLFLAIASIRGDIHPPGLVILLDYAHIKAKDHGLDVTAVFTSDGTVGLTIVETKAYKNRPNDAIGEAVNFFRQIREGTHDLRIRQAVQIMRTALPLSANTLVTGSFWKRNRVYICNPHYDSGTQIDWSNQRPSLGLLCSASEKTLIMPNALDDFDTFFDDIANRMRRFAEELQQCSMNMPAA